MESCTPTVVIIHFYALIRLHVYFLVSKSNPLQEKGADKKIPNIINQISCLTSIRTITMVFFWPNKLVLES